MCDRWIYGVSLPVKLWYTETYRNFIYFYESRWQVIVWVDLKM